MLAFVMHSVPITTKMAYVDNIFSRGRQSQYHGSWCPCYTMRLSINNLAVGAIRFQHHIVKCSPSLISMNYPWMYNDIINTYVLKCGYLAIALSAYVYCLLKQSNIVYLGHNILQMYLPFSEVGDYWHADALRASPICQGITQFIRPITAS